MTIYKCNNCGAYLSEEELVSEKICMEAYYGVSSDFPDRHYQNMSKCPYCEELNNFEEFEYDESDILDLVEEIERLKKEINKNDEEQKMINVSKIKSITNKYGYTFIYIHPSLNFGGQYKFTKEYKHFKLNVYLKVNEFDKVYHYFYLIEMKHTVLNINDIDEIIKVKEIIRDDIDKIDKMIKELNDD